MKRNTHRRKRSRFNLVLAAVSFSISSFIVINDDGTRMRYRNMVVNSLVNPQTVTRKFSGLDELGNRLAGRITKQESGTIPHRLLTPLNHIDDVASGMVIRWRRWYLPKFLGKSRNLGSDVALALSERGDTHHVAPYIENFEMMDPETVSELLERGHRRIVREGLRKARLNEPNSEVAEAFIGSDEEHYVMNHFHLFGEEYHPDIMDMLLGAEKYDIAARHLWQFEGVDHGEVTETLLDADADAIVATYISFFREVDHNEIAERILRKRNITLFCENIGNFRRLSDAIALYLMSAGRANCVAGYIHSFNSLSNTTARELLENGFLDSIANNISRFPELDGTVLRRLILNGREAQVVKHLDHFPELNDFAARRLMSQGYDDKVAENLPRFTGLSDDTLEELTRRGYGEAVENLRPNRLELTTSAPE